MSQPFVQNPPPPVGFAVPGGDMAYSNEEATAPPLDELVAPAGYQNASFKATILQPPALPVGNQFDPASLHRTVPAMAVIKEEEVKSALHEFVSSNCCYGSKPARELSVQDIVMKSSFKYRLETFTERRETKWKYEPYKGEPIDGPHNGRTPEPWEIFVPPNAAFENGTRKMPVPHSAVVRPCHKCGGSGRVRCWSCHGHGGKSCFFCNGSGRKDNERCFHCSGTGRDRCTSCSGHGQTKCNTCKGHCQIKCYIQLIVHWTNNADEFVSDETGLSEDLIKKASGDVAFEERYPRLYPLTNFPDDRILKASKGLIDKHSTAFNMERVLEQRHKVMIIPVALVYYKWRDQEGRFYVYGLDHKVSFEEYPHNCCWGICSIM